MLSDPQQHNTKEAWVCMSHIVLEGRRKPELSNVVTAHAISVKPLYNLDNST